MTAGKKTCIGCGKRIPEVALDCVFCSAKQPGPVLDEELGVERAAPPSLHATDPTLIGLKLAEVEAAVAARTPPRTAPAGGPPVDGPTATRHTPAMGSAETAVAAPSPPRAEGEPSARELPWSGPSRLLMTVAGVVFVVLFLLPWHGTTSWQLLRTLTGANFVRQLFYLAGGVVLLAAAWLPLPAAFRAAVGAVVAATPVVLGAAGLIAGWRGVMVALAILALPATHLLRSRGQAERAGRRLVLVAVGAVLLLYVVPTASVLPIAYVLKMVGSGQLTLTLMGLLALVPLVFAGLSALGALGRDLADVDVLLAALILLWAPVVVAFRGVLIEDRTQLYVALGIFWASATAALSVAQLLSLAASRSREPKPPES